MSKPPNSDINPPNELELLRKSHRQLEQHNAILLRLALAQQKSGLNFKETLEAFAMEVSEFLEVARVGIWVYSHDKSLLRCLELYDSSNCKHSSGTELRASDFPAYFAALKQQRVVSANDAMQDPRTIEFADTYLSVHGITSMLDSPIHLGGDLRGVMCCEHVGPLRNWMDEEQQFLASVTDLLASSIAASDIRRTEETMLALVESAAQGIIAINEAGNITAINSMVEKLFGYKRDELIGLPLEKLVPDDLKDSTLTIEGGNLRRSSGEKFGVSRTFTGHRKGGTTFPVEIALSYVEQDGEHLALALLTDITNRLESERKLRESEQLYRTIVEDQTDLITRCTPEGTRTFVNEAYCQYFKKKPSDLLNKSIFAGVPPQAEQQVRESFQSLSKEHPMNIHELKVPRWDGKFILTQWLDHAIFDESGKIREIQSIGRDISKQREAEIQLQEAQRLESIAVLASGIAHDFNNLLTPILLYAESLRDALKKESIEGNQAMQIQAAARRAKELVRQILTFGRTSHATEKEPIAIAPVIQDTLQLVRPSIPANIEIQISLDTECGVVEAEPTEIYQVLSNLCTNACQAMPRGGTLSVTASECLVDRSELMQGLYVLLTIKDTGSGIPKENLKNIFDPFFSTKKIGEGTGLGLSVVHGIVKGLGGHIDVQSLPEKGTTFTVYLPCSDKKPTAKHTQETSKRLPLAAQRVLVVDDEPWVLDSTQFMLQKLGCQVTALETGRDALACFTKEPEKFDIVLSDLTMPDINGTDLLSKIREIRPEIPTILMTGFAGLLDEEELQQKGIEHYVVKPLDSQELDSVLRECIAITKSSTGSMATAPATLGSVLVIDDDDLVRKAMKNLLISLGYQATIVSTVAAGLEVIGQHAIDAVLVDHFLDGMDGFAEADNLRKRAVEKNPDSDIQIIGMTGSGALTSEKRNSYALDDYLVKPFSADQLNQALHRQATT